MYFITSCTEGRKVFLTTDTIVRIGASCDQSDSPCEKLQVLPEALLADPICGSDGVSYANPLALMCAMTIDPSKYKLSSIILSFLTHQPNMRF
jgi:hypothetical protein